MTRLGSRGIIISIRLVSSVPIRLVSSVSIETSFPSRSINEMDIDRETFVFETIFEFPDDDATGSNLD